MVIEFTCVCGKHFRVDDKLAGRKGQCPQCGMKTRIPDLREQADDAHSAATSLPAAPVSTINNLNGQISPNATSIAPTTAGVSLESMPPPTISSGVGPVPPPRIAFNIPWARPVLQPQQITDYHELVSKCFANAAQADHLVCVNEIPTKKLELAKRFIALGLRVDEVPCVLVDNTILGSGKSGLLFTNVACHHKTDSVPGVFEYHDVVGHSGRTGWPKYELVVHLRTGELQTINFMSSAAQTSCEALLVQLVQSNFGAAQAMVQPSELPVIAPNEEIVTSIATRNGRCPDCQGTNVHEEVVTSKLGKFIDWIIGLSLYVSVAYRGGIIGLIIASVIWMVASAIIGFVSKTKVLTCEDCLHSWPKSTRRN